MVALSWGDTGQRFFETGIDRGVLYVKDAAVAWNGITAVSEKPTGGDSNPYYADGVKYLNLSSQEEYEATIEAWGAPQEFDLCLGIMSIAGLSFTQQLREPFALSYRTKIGNDVDGIDHAYKIHLIYGARASATEVTRQTLSDSPEPVKYSWDITTVPINVSGYTASAHWTIDSRSVSATSLAELESALYGTPNAAPFMPSPEYILNVIGGIALVEDPNDPGIFIIQYNSLTEDPNDPGTFIISKYGVTEDSAESGTYLVGGS